MVLSSLPRVSHPWAVPSHSLWLSGAHTQIGIGCPCPRAVLPIKGCRSCRVLGFSILWPVAPIWEMLRGLRVQARWLCRAVNLSGLQENWLTNLTVLWSPNWGPCIPIGVQEDAGRRYLSFNSFYLIVCFILYIMHWYTSTRVRFMGKELARYWRYMPKNTCINRSRQLKKFGGFAKSTELHWSILFPISCCVSTRVWNESKSSCPDTCSPWCWEHWMWGHRDTLGNVGEILKSWGGKLEAGRCLTFQESRFHSATFLEKTFSMDY